MPSFLQRLLDFLAAFFGLLLLWPVLVVLTIIGLFDTGAPIFRQRRVGKNQRTFTLVKFRTMAKAAPSVASHQVDTQMITPYGKFLRRVKLDELPQLINVLLGHMSLVGPRPCLPQQAELIAERRKHKVFSVRPGITGLAQLNDLDMSTPVKLAQVDGESIRTLTLAKYFTYILQTVTGKGAGDASLK